MTPEFADRPKFAIVLEGKKYALNEIDAVLDAMRKGAPVEVYPVKYLTSRKQKLFSLGGGAHIDVTETMAKWEELKALQSKPN